MQKEIVEFFKLHQDKWFTERQIREALGIGANNLHRSLNALCKKGILEKSQRGMYYNFRMKC